MVAGAIEILPRNPPVVVPTAGIRHPFAEYSVAEGNAHISRREKRVQDTLQGREIRGIADHFIAKRLLVLAECNRAQFPGGKRHDQIGKVPGFLLVFRGVKAIERVRRKIVHPVRLRPDIS